MHSLSPKQEIQPLALTGYFREPIAKGYYDKWGCDGHNQRKRIARGGEEGRKAFAGVDDNAVWHINRQGVFAYIEDMLVC